jgi:DNA modification methylase
MSDLGVKFQQNIDSVEDFTFEPIKGYPMLHWKGKRPFTSTQFYPAQLKESFGEETDGWMNKIFWGDNLQVMSHLLKEYRGQVDLIYIDPPFDSKADYKKKIKVRGQKATNDSTVFEEKQYTDIWSNDEYLQFMYERLILLRELLSEKGSIYVHMDEHRDSLVRLMMDEVFGAQNFKREIIWRIGWISGYKSKANQWIRNHDTILYYTKSSDYTFNKKYIPYPEGYRRRDGGVPEGQGYPIEDTWNCSDLDNLNSIQIMSFSSEKVGYPTQKNENLLQRIIECSSNEGDLIFDCFMGSGTTQAVAMKMGRRFIGADINLGAVDTTVKRLLRIQQEEDDKSNLFSATKTSKYTGFEVYNVNNYDIFRNPIEAKDLLKKALELQDLPANELYDGEKDGRMIKIMPINRIATRADLNELIMNFPYALFDKRQAEAINKPVELITLVCMGHEPDLGAQLVLQMKEAGYIIDAEVVDILRDKTNLEFKRESEAEIVKEGNKLVIRDFYPLNLMNKLSMQKEVIDDWRVLTDSVKIDFNYDGAVFSPSVVDVPNDKELVSGIYEIPSTAGNIRVKITDLLSESYEVTIR